MFINVAEFDTIYARIREENVANGTILILVAPDCDALCACRILTNIFTSDVLRYKVVPVANYGDLKSATDDVLTEDTEVRSIILLNCGATIDMFDTLRPSSSQSIYIIDSHRPYHLSNIRSDYQVILLDDGRGPDSVPPELLMQDAAEDEEEEEETDSDEDENDEEDEDSDDEDDEEDEEEGEDDDGGDKNDEQSKRRRRRRRKSNGDESKDEDERRRRRRRSENGESSGGSKKKKPLSYQKLKRRALRQYYGAGTFFGSSSARLMYELAEQLSKDTNEVLWFGIVGATEQFVQDKVSRGQYESDIDRFRGPVAHKNSHKPTETMIDGIAVPLPDPNRITAEIDLKFMLYRHWTLKDSMYHTPYVAAVLEVWKEQGLFALNRFLLELGVSQAQASTSFRTMRETVKKDLRTAIEVTAPQHDLHDIFFDSFLFTYDLSNIFSAADVVYAVSALLEGSSSSSSFVPEGAAASSDPSQFKPFVENFWHAHSALKISNADSVSLGIKRAKDLQQIVMRQAADLMEKNAIGHSGPFRHCTVPESAVASAAFAHPFTLCRLAKVLNEIIRHTKTRSKKQPKPKPMVISFRLAAQSRYLVAGVMPQQEDASTAKNIFGQAFRAAVERAGARVRHDAFDLSVIEVAQDDHRKFMETLVALLAG